MNNYLSDLRLAIVNKLEIDVEEIANVYEYNIDNPVFPHILFNGMNIQKLPIYNIHAEEISILFEILTASRDFEFISFLLDKVKNSIIDINIEIEGYRIISVLYDTGFIKQQQKKEGFKANLNFKIRLQKNN